jgi:hypothetical protein
MCSGNNDQKEDVEGQPSCTAHPEWRNNFTVRLPSSAETHNDAGISIVFIKILGMKTGKADTMKEL